MSYNLLIEIITYQENRDCYTLKEREIIRNSFKEEINKGLEKVMRNSFLKDN